MSKPRKPRKLREKLMKDLYHYGVMLPEDIAQGMIDKGWTRPSAGVSGPPQPVVQGTLTHQGQVINMITPAVVQSIHPEIFNRISSRENYLK